MLAYFGEIPIFVKVEYKNESRMKRIKGRVGLLVAGILVGAISGFLYWWFIGCESGTCPISSSPYISTLYGAILGGLLFSLFRIERKEK